MSRPPGIDRNDTERRNPLNERVRRPSCAAGWSEAAYTMARRRDTPTKGGTPGDDSEKKWQAEEKRSDREKEGGTGKEREREGESRRVHHAMTRYIPRTRVVGLMCLPYFPSHSLPLLSPSPFFSEPGSPSSASAMVPTTC